MTPLPTPSLLPYSHWTLAAGERARVTLRGDFALLSTTARVTVNGIPQTWAQCAPVADGIRVALNVPPEATPALYPFSLTVTDGGESRQSTTIRLTLEITPARRAPRRLPEPSPRPLAAVVAVLVTLWLGYSFWRGAQPDALLSARENAPDSALAFNLPLAQVPVRIAAQWSAALATPTLAPTPTLRPTATPLPPMPTPQPPPPTPEAQGRSAEQFVDGSYTYERMFQEVGAQFDIDWRLLASIAQRESNLNPAAVGGSGEQGMMQIMPDTWNQFATPIGASDPFDPYASTRVAAYYLVYLREYLYTQGRTEAYWLLVAYNWGPNNLRRHLAEGGDWGTIPTLRQNYAYTIIERINSPDNALWAEVLQDVPLYSSRGSQ